MDAIGQPPAGPTLSLDRAATWCLVALIGAALISLVWWSHAYLDPRNDACMYILLARNLLSGEGYSLLGEPFALRPPGFAALLAPLIAVWGTNLAVLNLFVNLFGVACVALLFALVRRRVGSRLALAVSLLLWINPGFRTFCNQVMSDVPGLALALGCLLLERRWRSRAPAHALVLGLCIGLSALVRTMNLLLLPAILLAAAVLRRGDGPRPGCAACSWCSEPRPRSCWVVRNAHADRPIACRSNRHPLLRYRDVSRGRG